MSYVVHVSLSKELADHWEDLPKGERSGVVQGLLSEYFKTKKVKVEKKPAVENKNVTAAVELWTELLGPPDGSIKLNRQYANNVITKYTLEKTLSAIRIIKVLKDDPKIEEKFKPKFGRFADLHDKWSKIQDYYNSNTKVVKKGPQF